MVTLPAFLQGVDNPVPRVKHPEWILKRKRAQDDAFKQQSLSSYFGRKGNFILIFWLVGLFLFFKILS
jgi:DNA polymerase epsilon subunit 1